MMKLWRTIPQALKEIKALDPDSAVTLYGLKKLVSDGAISHLPHGRTKLIDMVEVWGLEERKEK